ncbi:MAG: hypothetical protein RLZZ623_3942 [Actinomycetota bacterium]
MLSIIEARVVGCLLEKERTVPDQYPLTMNALLSACNQSQSREPIMRLEDHEIESAITTMKAAGLVRMVHPSHGRSVTRYRQVADEKWQLQPAEAAVVSVLLLRGPQTVAELRARTERQHSFGSLEDVESVLRALSDRQFVRLLDRQPGQKETRWQQLLADEAEHAVVLRSASGAAAEESVALHARIEQLEARVARLEAALEELL